MLEFNATILIAMISFIIFMFIMNIVLYEPMRKIVERRKNLLAINSEETLNNSNSSNKLIDEKNKALDETRVVIRGVISDITTQAKKEKAQIISEANTIASDKLNTVKTDLSNEVKDVKTGLKSGVVDLAAEILNKVTGQKIAIDGVSDEKISEVLNNGV